MAFWMSQVLLLITMVTMVYSSIELGRTSWGSWGEVESCNEDTVVDGFRLQVESYQGIWDDDTALTGIQFRCSDGKILTSRTLSRGSWTSWQYCPQYGKVTGVDLRSEPSQGVKDDTAANNLNVHCIDENNRGTWLYGEGLHFGYWQQGHCPTGQRVCSIQTLVEHHQGAGDDSALNRIKLNCCILPQL